ncbi:hypothetical protein [Cellulomonas wangsupingiae]|uniref:Uncharacterized protein n=1 Tax=Cellulomonas wangsupingiae TaxID=2968085 RepID=A0ABY5K3E1_9CELL|nr:hypothetical protein [Cellulomonas wangsupingiae]MCC2336130.1 hypothetical protein [Cellulomonas wangsupingiae]UUI64850.1 hypothetical protein NP075_17330 [Cellulomonas wangsupingiae]
MGVDEEFERVRRSLRTEEQALAQEFERIDAEARAAVDASVEHVRTELATQADRIREAIAQQRDELEARSEALRHDVEDAPDDTVADDVDAAPDGATEDDRVARDLDAAQSPQDADADAGALDPEEPADVPPAGTAEVTAVVDGEYPDDIVWTDEEDQGAPEPTAHVEQADGTDVSHVTAGGEGSDDRIGRVERGD